MPWVEHGRSIEGADCYGLLWLVHCECLGVDLPRYTDQWHGGVDRAALAALIAGEAREHWREIARRDELPFDAALIRDGRDPSHIGVVVAPGRMLHVERGKSSVIEAYRHGALSRRLLGFYRHRKADE